MRSENDKSTFDKLVNQALEDNEIVQAIDSSDLYNDFVRKQLAERSESVWSAVTQETAEVARIEEQLKAAQKRFNDDAPRESLLLVPLDFVPELVLALFFIIAAIATLISLFAGFRAVFGRFITQPWLSILIIASACAVSSVLLRKRLGKSRTMRNAAYAKSANDILRIPELEDQLAKGKQLVATALLERGIKAEIRSIINARLTPSYSSNLGVRSAPGLAEVFDPSYEISTDAKKKVLGLLEGMPGGSIGIAGPRGSGKSTLMWSLCRGAVKELGGRPLHAVMTSAPVKYDAREFILHLFSSLCYKVLGISPTENRIEEESDLAPQIHSFWVALVRNAIPLSLGIGALGVVFALIGLILASAVADSLERGPSESTSNNQYLAVSQRSAAKIQFSTNDESMTGPPVPTTLAVLSNRGISVRQTTPANKSTAGSQFIAINAVLPTNAVAMKGVITTNQLGRSESSATNAQTEDQTRNVARLVKAMDLKPGSLIMTGITLLIAGGFAFGVLQIPLVRNYRLIVAYGGMTTLSKRRKFEEEVSTRVGPAIAKMAFTILRDVRFQQSYSSGWSGALKFPFGIEGSINSAQSLAEKQRSLPEIVDAYRSFVKLVTETHAVLIGIDELDKLETDEAAQQFLNEIKSMFNLDRCYYLIAVSENAISSFERRGLPFRDAFDSAFDTIVYIDYLNLSNTKRLLQRRVINLDVPFMCVCYCLSGGLARDVIRACREMLELVHNEPLTTDLASICTKLVMADVRSKLRAISISVAEIGEEPETSRLIDRICGIEMSTRSSKVFLGARLAMPPPKIRLHFDEDAPQERAGKLQLINDLAIELHTYLYFSATVLEFFSETLSENKLKAAEGAGEIDKLARARQSFALNAYVSLELLDQFRKTNGLPVA